MNDLSLKISELNNNKSSLKTIHYGCESWFDVIDRPVAISCITIYELETGDSTAFSLTDYQNNSEEELLKEYYDFLRKSQESRLIHWNMNSSDYGFEAIDKRYKFLFGEPAPYIFPKEKRYDLDDLITFRYGNNYADDPKLSNLGLLNRYNKRYFLSGKDEAEKYKAKQFGDIKRSTKEKAHLISFLTNKFLEGTLETKNSGPRVAFANEKIDAVQIILELGQKFKAIKWELKRRHNNRSTLEINDEYDFQDLINTLFRIFFDDIRVEEWVPSYAGGNKRTDFLLPNYSIAVELKHTRKDLKARELGEQLLIDIENYKKHPSVNTILCLVYDYEGIIANPIGIEKDLTFIRDGYRAITKILQ